MATQPDYAYAFLLRACVREQLGQVEGALADEEQALQILEATLGGPRGELRRDFERGRSVVATLRSAVAAGRRRPTAPACEGFWDDADHPRTRSALLDAAEQARH